jgi:hypothetical protein
MKTKQNSILSFLFATVTRLSIYEKKEQLQNEKFDK